MPLIQQSQHKECKALDVCDYFLLKNLISLERGLRCCTQKVKSHKRELIIALFVFIVCELNIGYSGKHTKSL